MVKNLAAMQGTWVRSLARENTLEKGIAIHSSILAWRIQARSLRSYRGAWRATVHGVAQSGTGVGMWGGQQVPVLPQRVALQIQPCFTERLDRLGSDIC